MKYWNQYVALDLRNGQMVMKDKTPYSSTVGDIPIKVDVEQQTCELQLRDRTFICRFTNNPLPPRVVAHLTNENSVSFPKPPAAAQAGKTKDTNDDPANAELPEKLKLAQEQLRKSREEMQKLLDEERKAPINPKGKK